MADYEYEGEKFQVVDVGGSETKVSDEVNIISITPNNSRSSNYRVTHTDSGWWFKATEPKESLDQACWMLIRLRDTITPDQACKDMSELVKTL